MAAVKELESGMWIVQGLLKSLNESLSLKVGVSSKNTTELCISYYKRTDPNGISVRGEKSCLHLSERAKALIEKTIQQEQPQAYLSEFTEEDTKKIGDAMRILKEIDPYLHLLTEKSLTGFVRIANVEYRSSSYPHLFGVIAIGDGVEKLNAKNLAISIVHEFAHYELFLINMIDRLIVKGFDFSELHAPFQGKKRPPIGRLHSLWALYRMVQFEKREGEINLTHQKLLHENANAFQAGELTEFAKALVGIAARMAV